MRRFLKGLAVLIAGGATAVAIAAGGGPTTVGDASFHANSLAYGDAVLVQAADSPKGPSYAVPAPGGVLTSWSLQLARANVDGDVKLKLVQPLGGDVYKVVGEATGHVLTGDRYRTFTTRIPVAAGVRLGVRAPQLDLSIGSDYDGVGNDPGDVRIVSGDPATGATITVSNFATNSRMTLSAVVEPDADHDQYGDTSQDACPADPDRHAGACVTDLSLSLGATPSSIPQGEAAVVSGAVNAALATASGATVNVVLPPGLALITGQASGGACSGVATVSCPLGDVTPGTPAHAVLAVRGAQTGAQSVGGSVASGTSDGNASNDSSSATVNVTPAAAVPKECVVPPLKGLTKKGASKLLKAFNCALGKVTTKRKPRRGRPRVSSSKPKAATRAPAGTKVAITLKRLR